MNKPTQKAGKVYLVGAGPGDPELITVRGRKLIELCDALVYDYLVAECMLDWAPQAAQRICVGKREGFHSVPQEEIQAILVDLAKAGKTIVRLKGGDPLVFGRGGEEVRCLEQAGVAWEIVPGITAALGVAAQIGMPLTDRNYASGVLFLTGHENPDKVENALQWERYGALGLTLCLYMSMKHLESLCAALVRGGASAKTPVRVTQWATTPQERSCVGTLETIAADVLKAGLGAPAMVVVGEVANKAARP